VYNRLRIYNKQKGWAAVFVPRCGTGSLKTLCFRDAKGYHPELNIHLMGYHPELNIHSIIPSIDGERHGIIVNGYWPEDCYKFAVWRDPLQRSISCWRGFTQGITPHVFPHLHHCSFDEWAEFLQKIVRPEMIEPHIKRQIDSYDAEELDAIVPLDRLEEFMRSAYGYDYIPKQGSSKEIKTNLPITDRGVDIISDIYAEDLAVPILYHSKVY